MPHVKVGWCNVKAVIDFSSCPILCRLAEIEYMIAAKQLSFLTALDTKGNHIQHENHTKWQLYVDGASRNNPGFSGAGLFVTKDDIPCYKQGFFLGVKTNNQAEYIACILGMYTLEHVLVCQKNDTIAIFSDS